MPNQFLYPRPEYPRPDKQRGTLNGIDWLNLNGAWQFRFDPRREGVDQRWFDPNLPDWREQIIVPFCWESLAAWGDGDTAGNETFYSTRVFTNPLEVTRENHRSAPRYEVGWYRRLVELPNSEAWLNKRAILHIGAADFFTDCWCNGVHLGHHEGGYTPFEFDLTDVLVEQNGSKRAHLVFRVEDPMDNSEQPVGKQWRWYTTTSGIWQTVYLEPRAATHIRSFRILGDADNESARFIIKCSHTTPGCQVEAEITAPDQTIGKHVLTVRHGLADQAVKLSSLGVWDPNRPDLYRVTLRLRRGSEVVDTVRTYFGIRKVDFELAEESGLPSGIRLNGVPRFLRGALYQSYFPDGVYTASSVETLKNDILWAKKFGFNFLRVHIKIDDPLLLYYADELGMLLMQDLPNFGEGGDTPLGRQRFEVMMREAIERDFNHPSIFAWCLFNETWGFGGQIGFIEQLLAPPPGKATLPDGPKPSAENKKRAAGARPGMTPPQQWVQEMWELAKQLDPTRLVEDMSVCHWDHLEYFLHCDTDINSWHFYISDYAKAKEHLQKIVGSTFLGSSFNYVPGFLHKGAPLINSEYGGVGALDGDRDVSWSFKFLTNELRRYQQIAAYIYTELHDVEWEYNGFLNYDRTLKEFGYNPRLVNESNALPIDSAPVQRVNPGQRVVLEVASSHFSSRKYENVTLRWALAGIDSRGRVHQDIATGCTPIPFPHRQVAPAYSLELTLPQNTMLCTLVLTAHAQDGSQIAENFLHYLVSAGYPAEREERDRGLILRAHPGSWVRAEWSLGCVDRDAARKEDACWGQGHGFFEWHLPLQGLDLSNTHKLRMVCESSSHRPDIHQTDSDVVPTSFRVSVNDIPIYQASLRNHPHDSRGVLSYLRGGAGAYGYLAYATAEHELLNRIAAATQDDHLRLRCEVPAEATPRGGLTVYGAESGRFPVCPTLLIDQ